MSSLYQKELDFIKKLLPEAYQACFFSVEHTKTTKNAFDIVTPVDVTTEKYIIDALNNEFPTDNILSEETHHDEVVKDRTWTLDPIDGTVNMANGSPLFGMQISMFMGGEPVVCAIYLPALKELYWASKGEGAYCNGVRLSVHHVDPVDAAFNFGDYVFDNEEWFTKESQVVRYLSSRIKRIRFFGAASMDFAFTASNRACGYMIFTDNYWDIAPGILLCREAGSHIYSLDGKFHFGDKCVIATNSDEVYELILESLK